MKTIPRTYIHLAYFIFIILAVQVLGLYFTLHSVHTWYPNLIKPSWNPPDWVFGPVWTVLYLMIAISGWLVYEEPPSPHRYAGLFFYWWQLILNALWSGFFFFLQNPLWAFIDILFLEMMIALTIMGFWKVHRLAALLLVPYFLWVAYAASLNLAIWILNRT